jgi:butyryl-CoA dehydrogenase
MDQMIYEMCRKFADEELAPNAGMWDKKHQFPAEAIGLMGINVSTDFGALGI